MLLLDEPTASLDPSAKREVEALIDEFAADGVTVVMSTHNLGQAKRLATRVVYLEAGGCVVDLPVRSVLQRCAAARGGHCSSKENCHGSDSNCRCRGAALLLGAAAGGVTLRRRRGAGQVSS